MVAEPLRVVPQREGPDENPDLILRFNEIHAQREPIIINDREYSAYHWNKRVPRSVRAMVFDAHQEARDSTAGSSRRYRSQLALENATTKTLMALIPTLGYETCDALDSDEVFKIEVRLGLREDPQAVRREDDPEREPHPPSGGTKNSSKRQTGEKSSSGSQRRSA